MRPRRRTCGCIYCPMCSEIDWEYPSSLDANCYARLNAAERERVRSGEEAAWAMHRERHGLFPMLRFRLYRLFLAVAGWCYPKLRREP